MQTLRRVAATVAVGAIVMAGCGGSDDEADDAGTSDPVATVPPSEPAEEADLG